MSGQEKLDNPFDKAEEDFLPFQSSTPQASPGSCLNVY